MNLGNVNTETDLTKLGLYISNRIICPPLKVLSNSDTSEIIDSPFEKSKLYVFTGIYSSYFGEALTSWDSDHADKYPFMYCFNEGKHMFFDFPLLRRNSLNAEYVKGRCTLLLINGKFSITNIYPTIDVDDEIIVGLRGIYLN